MERPSWSLNWEKYVGRSRIDTSGKCVTVVFGFESSQACQNELLSLKAWLKSKGYSLGRKVLRDPRSPHDQGFSVTLARLDSEVVSIVEGYNNDMLVRCSRGRSYRDVRSFSLGFRTRRVVFCAEVKHGIRRRALGRIGTLTEYVGYDRNDAMEFYPYKFMELRKDKSLIAKALVSHFNLEMSESAPTMELLEVVKAHQRKGIGTSIVRLIEKEVKREGYNKIWGTDASLSYKFLKKLGYTFDLDEGEKYFTQ